MTTTPSHDSQNVLADLLRPARDWIARGQFSRRYVQPLPDPLIAHIHVPKCGGTSFRHFLTKHYGPSHLELYVADTFFVYSEEELTAAVKDRSVTGFSSHFVRTFPEKLAGRDVLYITFLRDPIDQFVSYITYVKKNFHSIQDVPLLSCFPPDPPSLSVRDIAHWILTSNREINFRENYSVNFFARYSLLAEAGPRRSDNAYRKRRVSTAERILQRFFFVGVSEQMDQSIAVLGELMKRVGLNLPEGDIPLENTSYEFRDDLSWIRPDDPVGRLLLNSIQEDQQLYRFALTRLRTLKMIASSPV